MKPNLPDENEELASADDSAIGPAVKWSLLALLFLVIVGGVVFFLKTKKAAAPVRQTKLTAPTSAGKPAIEIPEARFSDVTRSAGISFVHNNGAYGDKLLPETMGGGVAFLDFDNDGHQDLLLVNSTYWPGKIPPGKSPTTAALYRNDGRGNFTDVTAGSGLDVPLYGMGVAVGDYDNDGLPDVLLTAVGGCRLFHNEGGGKFRDVTVAAGVGGLTNDWSTSAAFIDYDNDGKLDLFVGHYVQWSREIDFGVGYTLVGVGRAYGQPMNFAGSHPRLFHNEGNGRFRDVSVEAGVQIKNPATGAAAAKSLGVAAVDYDGDGWIDLIVANDTVQNFVFHNEHNGTFKEVGALSGVAFDSYGNTRGAMGIDVAAFRNDGDLGVAIGNFANEMTALYVSRRQGTNVFFTDEAITEGIGPASRLLLKFGIFFFDYDLDGRLDVLTANGHLEEEISKIQKSQSYRQPAQLFWNSGRGPCFLPVPPGKAGEDLFKPMVGRGSAYADIDGDGDLDVILTQVGGPPLLLRNEQKTGNHWVRFKLVGTKSNRDAIGAWVKVSSKGRVMSRQVMAAKSYLSQSELPVTIGLGLETTVDGVEILWPGGRVQKLSGVRINALNVIREE